MARRQPYPVPRQQHPAACARDLPGVQVRPTAFSPMHAQCGVTLHDIMFISMHAVRHPKQCHAVYSLLLLLLMSWSGERAHAAWSFHCHALIGLL